MTKHNEGAKLTEIKVGDKVRVHGNGAARKTWVGTEGIVTKIDGSGWGVTHLRLTKATDTEYKVGQDVKVSHGNLEKIPYFKFADIQQGDVIRRTFTRNDGTKVIWEGEAFRLNYDDSTWLTDGGYQLAHDADDNHDDVALELLDRPKPKHWADKKPVGSVGYRTSINTRNSKLFRKTGEDTWEVEYVLSGIRNEHTNRGIETTFMDLKETSFEWLA